MDKTDYLAPGYTLQGSAAVQASLWSCSEKINSKIGLLGKISAVPVYVICKAAEYLESPIQTIESLALLIINLVGAVWNEGCRNNLKYCAVSLKENIFMCLTSAVIVLIAIEILPLFAIYHGYKVVDNIVLNDNLEPHLKNKIDSNWAQYERINAIRLLGYGNVRKVEELFPKDYKIPLVMYNILLKLQKDQFDNFYEDLKKQYNEKTRQQPKPTTSAWVCPADLENDKSDTATTIKHILKNSYGIDASKMNDTQKKGFLCTLLGLGSDADDRIIKVKRFAVLRQIHPDKVIDSLKVHATTAMQVMNNVVVIA